MKAIIYCTRSDKGGMDFYLMTKNDQHYLYHAEKFSIRVFNEYCGGKDLSHVFRGSRAYNSQNTKDRLIRTLSYIEKENDISILNKTERAKQRSPQRRQTKDYDEELYM